MLGYLPAGTGGKAMTSPKETAAPLQAAIPNSNKTKSTSATDQRQRILERLRLAPATTIELRQELDVMAPAPRIFELRHNYGYEIDSRMVVDETMPEHKHSVAQYTLIREAEL